MNSVLEFLEINRERLGLRERGIDGPLSCVTLAPRFRASGHVVFLLLREGESHPVLVAKVPRLAGLSEEMNFPTALSREASNLRRAAARDVGGSSSVPRLVAFEQYRALPILVETALVGNLMDAAAVRKNPGACCRAVTEWLIDLQSPPDEAATDRCDDPAGRYDRLIEQPLCRFAESFPLSREEQQLLERTVDLVAPLAEIDLPPVFEHGDLSSPNILLLRQGGVGVVDWELAEPDGMPGVDLFFFLTFAAFALSRARSNGDTVAAFHEAFFGKAAWARPFITSYWEHLQEKAGLVVPAPALTPLFIACWARYTTNLLRRLGAGRNNQAVAQADTLAWLRSNRYYALWQHAVAQVTELGWRGTT